MQLIMVVATLAIIAIGTLSTCLAQADNKTDRIIAPQPPCHHINMPNFEAMDLDDSGTVSRTEHMMFYDREFDRLDHDGDGMIEKGKCEPVMPMHRSQ
ncbi:MAG: hypothetical protein MRY32_00660 [Rickettsiales bacterium]|nr:hypothetical protein [Rickettsiales bacterium]